MKKIFTAVLAASLMLIGTSAFAQFSVGAGFVQSTDKVKSGNTETSTPMNGLYAGASYNIAFGDSGLGLAPGVYYSLLTKKDAKEYGGIASTKVDVTEHYLSVPVLFNYGFRLGDGFKLGLYAGPTMAYGLASTVKSKVETTELPLIGKITSDSKADAYKEGSHYGRFDVMLGGGVACEFADMVRFEVGYDYGMLNRYTGDASDVSRHRSQLHAGVAFLF